MLSAGESKEHRRNAMEFRPKRSFFPKCLKIGVNGKKLDVVPVEVSTHVYLGRVEGFLNGYVNASVFGCVTPCYGVSHDDGSSDLFYAVKQETYGLPSETLAIITRHTSELYDSIDFSHPTSISNLLRPGISTLSKGWSLEEAVNSKNTKISAQHHIHFSFKEILGVLGEGNIGIKFALRITREATNTMLAGVALWASALPAHVLQELISSKLMWVEKVSEFKENMKRVTVEAKSLQNIVATDLRSLFEVEVLVNRVDGMVDWQAEYENRTKPHYARVSKEKVLREASKLFRNSLANGKRVRKIEWKDFWDSRWQWSASGSIHSQYQGDMDYVEKDIYLKNKFITLLKMKDSTHQDWSNRRPEIQAWASTKYEWGKLRAIYGTDLTSYINAHFAFYNCEDVLPAPFPVGKAANTENVSNRVGATLKGRTQYCVDFEDFNSQHSPDNMSAVIQAYIEVFGHQMTQDQVNAAEWTRQSVHSMIVRDNQGLKKTYKANGTLLSGWRLTTFMNSVLNYIYSKVIAPEVVESRNSLHNGDDVLMGAKNYGQVLESVKRATDLDIRLQKSKCSFAATAEFLRVDHKHGSKGQYLARAVATILHSRIESKPSYDVRDLAEAMEDRLGDVYSRGMSLETVIKLRRQYYLRQSEELEISPDQIYQIKAAHRCVGGISSAKDAEVSHLIVSKGFKKGATQLGVLPGAVDYSRKVRQELQLDKPLQQFISRIMQSTYDAVIPKDRNIRLLINDDTKRYVTLRALYKVHKSDTDIVNYGKAKMTGFLMDVLAQQSKSATLLRILKASKDPLTLLNVVA
ncbi:RNA-dependent RNA polymerase [Hortaea werneckii totivirus 1]|nr:RNA-dependent RNA polymerase [Hortaea werneckii totivirus 1]